MTTDMNGREIKIFDTYCSPSDCDTLQFIGIVLEIEDDCITGCQMTVSDTSQCFNTHSYHDPKEIKVLASIEDTREVAKESVTA